MKRGGKRGRTEAYKYGNENVEQNGNSIETVLNLLVKKISKSLEIQHSFFHKKEKHNGRLNVKLLWPYFKITEE